VCLCERVCVCLCVRGVFAMQDMSIVEMGDTPLCICVCVCVCVGARETASERKKHARKRYLLWGGYYS